MSQISYGRYRTFYPKLKTKKGDIYRIEYAQIRRAFEVYFNGKRLSQHQHSDFALLAILQHSTPFRGGDEVPPQYRQALARLEKAFGIVYQGLKNE